MGMQMHWSIAPALVLGLLSATSASGQEAFTFSWQVQDVPGVGPANGNGVIEPGEDAMIYLYASFRPGVGGTAIWDTHGGTGQEGIVAGLGETVFHVIGTQNLSTGSWISLSPVPGFALSPIGFIEPGTNNLISMIFGQYLLPEQAPNPRNDDWFFHARWRPNDYAPRDVSFVFQNVIGPGNPSVFLDVGIRGPQGQIECRRDRWLYNEPLGGFAVIPSPGTLPAVLLFAPHMLRRRLRSSVPR